MDRRGFVSLLAASGLTSLALGPSRVLAGACATPSFTAGYLGAEAARIRRGGALLVGLTQGFGGGDSNADPLSGAYTLEREGASIPLRSERTAPGLLRLVPTRFVPGTYTARGPAGTREVTLEDGIAPTLAPAVLEKVELVRSPGSSQPYFPATWGLVATLRAPLPVNVLGVLVALEAAGSPYRLFASATAGERSVRLYSSPGRCTRDVPDAAPPSATDIVRIAVLDARGVVSARSNHVTIREA